MIRWKQQVRFGRTSSVGFRQIHDLVRYVEQFRSRRLSSDRAVRLRPILADALNSKVPAVIDCPVDYSENLRLTERLKISSILNRHSRMRPVSGAIARISSACEACNCRTQSGKCYSQSNSHDQGAEEGGLLGTIRR